MRACVYTVIVGSYSSRNQEQPQEQTCRSAFFCSFSCLLCCLPLLAAAVCLYHNVVSCWHCGSHGTTVLVAVLQGPHFVTATNGASLCACVRTMWACRHEHNEGQFQSTLPLKFKSIRAVQQRYNSSSNTREFATLVYIGMPVFPLFNLRHPWDVKSTTSRRGTLFQDPRYQDTKAQVESYVTVL